MNTRSLIDQAHNIFNEFRLQEIMDSSFVSDALDYRGCFRWLRPQYNNLKPWNRPLSDLSVFNGSDNCRIYVSVPFCGNSCSFCGNTDRFRKNCSRFLPSYIAYLKREITLFGQYIDFQSLKIKYLSFGGGTPTILSSEQLIEIMRYFKRIFSFDQNAYFSIEADPNTLKGQSGLEKLKLLKGMGFDRVSIGAQDFNDKILREIGRSHTSSDTIEAFTNARKAGFGEINLDLIYGLPGQSLESWSRSISQAIDLKPDNLAFYKLRFDLCTSLFLRFVKERKSFPSNKECLLMRIMAKEGFTDSGYKEESAGVFRKETHSLERNYCFSKGTHCLALGVKVRGQAKDINYYNVTNEKYFKKLDSNILPIRSMVRFSKKQLMNRDLIFNLDIVKQGFTKKDFFQKYNVDFEKIYGRILPILEEYGFIQNTNETLKLTYKGTLFSDNIYKELCQLSWFNKVSLYDRRQLCYKYILKPLAKLFTSGGLRP